MVERAALYVASAVSVGLAGLLLAKGVPSVRAGAVLVAVGSTVLAAGLLVSLFSAVWMVTFLGEIISIIGAVVLAIAMIGTNIVPVPVAVLLGIGGLMLGVMNVVESASLLLAAPYGLAWLAVGVSLRPGPTRRTG